MAKQEARKKRSLFKKLTDTYRLLIIDEDTFEHKLDFSLSRLNVFAVTGFLALLLIVGTVFLIAYTPLREYIPGYPSSELRKKVYQLELFKDSLSREVQMRDRYIESFRKVMTGEITPEEISRKALSDSIAAVDTAALKPSREDSLLRKEVERKEAFRVTDNRQTEISFLPPVRGPISRRFDPSAGHLGVDIVLPQNTPVKAVAQGRVLFTGWTPDNGNVLVLIHPQHFVSVYKHNRKLLKQTGQKVEAGEVIARAGNTGENSTGPHLHFELWHNNRPVNPELYMQLAKP